LSSNETLSPNFFEGPDTELNSSIDAEAVTSLSAAVVRERAEGDGIDDVLGVTQ